MRLMPRESAGNRVPKAKAYQLMSVLKKAAAFKGGRLHAETWLLKKFPPRLWL